VDFAKGKRLQALEQAITGDEYGLNGVALALRELTWFAAEGLVQPYPTLEPPTEPGLYRWRQSSGWAQAHPESLRRVNVLDFESKHLDRWLPTIATIFSADQEGCDWFYWSRSSGATMPFPGDRIVIGCNSIAHDRRFLSSEYSLDCNTIHFDILQLSLLIAGLSDSDDDPGAMRSQWNAFHAQHTEDKGTPEWYAQTHPSDLNTLAQRYLGDEKLKGIGIYKYCAHDTWLTARLFQKLWKLAQAYVSSPITWYGMIRQAQARYFLRGWQGFLEQSETEYQTAIGRLEKLQQHLEAIAIADSERETNYPTLNWDEYKRGPNKGRFKWQGELDKGSPMGTAIAVQLMRLTWDGAPIEYVGGREKWQAAGVSLPHPDGNGFVENPLVSGYHDHARSGRLASALPKLPQAKLLLVFEILESIRQWQNYRSRYENQNYQQVADGLMCSTFDLNTCGTISRRSKGLPVVWPKPSDKIGSSIMRHVVAPDGFVLVGADFDSQESRLAAQVFTDCRVGRHGSSEWSMAVLQGDKALKTDIHSRTAQMLGIDRADAKTINFLLQYGGGLNLLTATLQTMGKSRVDAEKLAAEFMARLTGHGGMSESTYKNLEYLRNIDDLRTYLLGVKQPNSINPKYLPSRDRSFKLLRKNHPIQSAGVDEKHVLIAMIDAMAQHFKLDATFAFEVHDHVYYYCAIHHASKLKEIFNVAMGKLADMSLEQATLFWDAIAPGFGDAPARQPLEQLPQWRRFESVEISKNMAGDSHE